MAVRGMSCALPSLAMLYSLPGPVAGRLPSGTALRSHYAAMLPLVRWANHDHHHAWLIHGTLRVRFRQHVWEGVVSSGPALSASKAAQKETSARRSCMAARKKAPRCRGPPIVRRRLRLCTAPSVRPTVRDSGESSRRLGGKWQWDSESDPTGRGRRLRQ